METSKRCVKLFSLIFILKCSSKFNIIIVIIIIIIIIYSNKFKGDLRKKLRKKKR